MLQPNALCLIDLFKICCATNKDDGCKNQFDSLVYEAVRAVKCKLVRGGHPEGIEQYKKQQQQQQ